MRILFSTLLLLGCGTDDGANQRPAQNAPTDVQDEQKLPQEGETTPEGDEPLKTAAIHSLTVDTKAKLLECSPANDRQLVYVIEEKAFYTCSNLQWASIDLRGPAGTAGSTGTNGNDNHVTTTYSCSIDLAPAAFKGLYERAETSYGDSWVTARLEGSASTDAIYTVTDFYAKSQDASTIRINHDAVSSNNGGHFKFVFDKSINQLTVSVHDADYVSNVNTWTTSCAKESF